MTDHLLKSLHMYFSSFLGIVASVLFFLLALNNRRASYCDARQSSWDRMLGAPCLPARAAARELTASCVMSLSRARADFCTACRVQI